jgi:hypothetical protein
MACSYFLSQVSVHALPTAKQRIRCDCVNLGARPRGLQFKLGFGFEQSVTADSAADCASTPSRLGARPAVCYSVVSVPVIRISAGKGQHRGPADSESHSALTGRFGARVVGLILDSGSEFMPSVTHLVSAW